MDEALIILYSLSSVMFGLGFIPQIITLYKDTTQAEAFSLGTSLTFSLATLIAFLYAVFINGDFYFTLSAGSCLVGNLTILVLGCVRRFELSLKDFKSVLIIRTNHI